MVSCERVDDEALAAVPEFPLFVDLLPMDVSVAGFRHVGRCRNLEKLWCMYCRHTGVVHALERATTSHSWL